MELYFTFNQERYSKCSLLLFFPPYKTNLVRARSATAPQQGVAVREAPPERSRSQSYFAPESNTPLSLGIRTAAERLPKETIRGNALEAIKQLRNRDKKLTGAQIVENIFSLKEGESEYYQTIRIAFKTEHRWSEFSESSCYIVAQLIMQEGRVEVEKEAAHVRTMIQSFFQLHVIREDFINKIISLYKEAFILQKELKQNEILKTHFEHFYEVVLNPLKEELSKKCLSKKDLQELKTTFFSNLWDIVLKVFRFAPQFAQEKIFPFLLNREVQTWLARDLCVAVDKGEIVEQQDDLKEQLLSIFSKVKQWKFSEGKQDMSLDFLGQDALNGLIDDLIKIVQEKIQSLKV